MFLPTKSRFEGIHPDPGSSSCHELFNDEYEMVAGSQATFSLKSFDDFGQAQPFGGDRYYGVLTGGDRLTPSRVEATITDLGTGIYTGKFSVTITGAYALEITLGGQLVDFWQREFPYKVKVLVSEPSPAHSLVYGPSYNQWSIWNQTGEGMINVQMRDKFENNVTERREDVWKEGLPGTEGKVKGKDKFVVVDGKRVTVEDERIAWADSIFTMFRPSLGPNFASGTGLNYGVTNAYEGKGVFSMKFRTTRSGTYKATISMNNIVRSPP